MTDKIHKALSTLDSLCVKEKSLVNKFIVMGMNKVLRTGFQDIERLIDTQSNHVQELIEENKELKEKLATAEKVISTAIINMEKSESPFYAGIKALKEYEEISK